MFGHDLEDVRDELRSTNEHLNRIEVLLQELVTISGELAAGKSGCGDTLGCDE